MILKCLISVPEKSPVITTLGETMASFPVSPRYAKMLTLAQTYQVVPYAIALVAALSVDEIFVDNIQPLDAEGDVSDVDAVIDGKSIVSCFSFVVFCNEGQAKLKPTTANKNLPFSSSYDFLISKSIKVFIDLKIFLLFKLLFAI